MREGVVQALFDPSGLFEGEGWRIGVALSVEEAIQPAAERVDVCGLNCFCHVQMVEDAVDLNGGERFQLVLAVELKKALEPVFELQGGHALCSVVVYGLSIVTFDWCVQ